MSNHYHQKQNFLSLNNTFNKEYDDDKTAI